VTATDGRYELEARARAERVKSEGIRLLLAASYSVADAARVIGIDYAFAYGVAKRAGYVATSRTGRGAMRSEAPLSASDPNGANEQDGLDAEFRRIASDHRAAILKMTARSALPASVTRVFEAHTKDALVELLLTVPIDDLVEMADEATFATWYERQLGRVAACVLRLNPPELRPGVHPGYHWGHAAKVLALYVRDVVLYSRYFSDREVEQVSPLLYCPIDGVVLERLRRVGVRPGVTRIREIATREKFRALQDVLKAAAAEAGVPPVWFDDVWGDRD
jgi:hypothetical protein